MEWGGGGSGEVEVGRWKWGGGRGRWREGGGCGVDCRIAKHVTPWGLIAMGTLQIRVVVEGSIGKDMFRVSLVFLELVLSPESIEQGSSAGFCCTGLHGGLAYRELAQRIFLTELAQRTFAQILLREVSRKNLPTFAPNN